MEQRDGHMHKKYLKTKDFPDNIQAAELALPAPGKPTVEGTFGIHGQEKKIKVLFTMAENTADKIVLRATWTLNIGDFGIKHQSSWWWKMDKELKMGSNGSHEKEVKQRRLHLVQGLALVLGFGLVSASEALIRNSLPRVIPAVPAVTTRPMAALWPMLTV